MKINARVTNTRDEHRVVLATNGTERTLAIAPKPGARGSSVNGGELLLAALATCFCNDLFREAARRGIQLDNVDVAAEAIFPAEGAPAERVAYHVTLSGSADDAVMRELVEATDVVAEIQNTVRTAIPVALGEVTITRSETSSAVSSA